MSYDLYFLRRDPGQSFEDALDAVEQALEEDPQPLDESDLELWDDVVRVARDVLGELEEFDDELNTRELVHRPSGIQLAILNGEVSLHVRGGHPGDGGETSRLVSELSEAIERETGLEGYDTQREAPVSDTEGEGAPVRSGSASWDDEEGRESDGTSTSLPVIRAKQLSGAGAPVEDRRWWEFWKR